MRLAISERIHRKIICSKRVGDLIYIAGEFPDEFTESQYTKKLRGGLAKAKANSGHVIGEMIENAPNRRWIENKDEKHKKEVSVGWYRYDVAFIIPIDDAGAVRRNAYQATAVVGIKEDKLYQLLLAFDQLYDTFSEVEQRDFVRAFIEYIDIYPENRRMTARFGILCSIFRYLLSDRK